MNQKLLDEAKDSGTIIPLIELLQNKELPIETVKEIYFSFKENKELVGQVAMNLSLRTSVYARDKEYSDTIVELLTHIATNPADMGARWAVAKNPHTPIDILRVLAKDDVNLVRALVCANPSAPSDILEKFFNDEKIVRDALSGNPNTPQKLLKILSSDNDKMVRMRLCENSATSKEVLESLLQDTDPEVVKAAEINLGKHA